MRSMHSAEYTHVRTQLRRAREARGMTQKEVALALGVPRVRIVKMEAGYRRVDAVEIAMFMRLYKKPFSYFVQVRK